MKLYRVVYVHRSAPDAMPQEKVAFIAAETHEIAGAHVGAKPGNEVQGVNVHVPAIEVAKAEDKPSPGIVEPGALISSDDELESAYQRAMKKKGK